MWRCEMAGHGIARRSVLRFVGMSTAAAVLAACRATPVPTTAPPATEAPAVTEVPAETAAPTQVAVGGPRYGGTYRIISGGFVSLDPPGGGSFG